MNQPQICSSGMIYTIAQQYSEERISNSCHKAISIRHFIRNYIASSPPSRHFLSCSSFLLYCCLYSFTINNTGNVSTVGYKRGFIIYCIIVMAEHTFPKFIYLHSFRGLFHKDKYICSYARTHSSYSII